MPLSKDEIVALKDRRETRKVTIDGFGDFILKEMSGTDRDAYEQSIVRMNGQSATPNMANIRAKLVSKCLVDEAGELLFPTPKDVADLGHLPARVLSKLFDAAAEMNGLSDEAVEDLLGNSDAAQSGDSISR